MSLFRRAIRLFLLVACVAAACVAAIVAVIFRQLVRPPRQALVWCPGQVEAVAAPWSAHELPSPRTCLLRKGAT